VSELEDSYRRVLRLLPASYRAERGEEMVAAFGESAGPDGAGDDAEEPRRPSWPEIASVAALGVRLRLGGVGAAPRSFAWGETVRLVAVLGLFFHAAVTFLYLGGALRLTAVPDGVPVEYARPYATPEPWWTAVATLSGAAWVVAAAALAAARVRLAKVLAVVALTAELGQVVSTLTDPWWWDSLRARAPLALLTIVPVIALLAGFHRDAPPVRWSRRPGVWALLGGGALLAAALGALASRINVHPWAWPWVDMPGVACTPLLLGGVAYLAVHGGAARSARTAEATPAAAAWPLALAILTAPVLCARLSVLRFDAPDAATHTMTLIGSAQCAALLLVGIALLILGARALPRPPASPMAARREDRETPAAGGRQRE
jgi:hypothetical protein